jgi:hypothetical protein
MNEERKPLTMEAIKKAYDHLNSLPRVRDYYCHLSIENWKQLREHDKDYSFTDEELSNALENGYIGEKAGIKCYISKTENFAWKKKN